MKCKFCDEPASTRIRKHPEIPRCHKHSSRYNRRTCDVCGDTAYVDRKCLSTRCADCSRKQLTPSAGVQRYLITSDMHVPHHDETLMELILSYAREHEWAGWIDLGDMLDFDCISHHNKTQIRKYEGKRIKDQYKMGEKVLRSYAEAVRFQNPGATITLLEGNHEYWVERYIDEFPQFEGMLEVENMMPFDELNVNWIRSWKDGEVYQLGNLSMIHGWSINKYHASAHVSAAGTNILYGHVHDLQTYSFKRRGDNKTIQGKSIGCLCNYDQSYLLGKPTNWQKSFAVLHLFDDGYYQIFDVLAFKDRFISPEGEVFS